jgi:hypothetical protein
MSIYDTLVQVRSKYGASPTTNECGEICNETAWIHRNDPEKWGVNTKNFGTHAILHDGSNVAADIIQNGVTLEAYDCLGSAGDGGSATPQWLAVGVITDSNRPWKSPVPPQDTNPPDPPDPPNNDDEILEAIDEVSLAIAELKQFITVEFIKLNDDLEVLKSALRQDSPVSLSFGIKGTVKGKVIP